MMRLAQLAGRSFRHAGPVSHPPGLLSPTFFSQVRNYAHRGEVTCSHVTIQLGPPFEVQVPPGHCHLALDALILPSQSLPNRNEPQVGGKEKGLKGGRG